MTPALVGKFPSEGLNVLLEGSDRTAVVTEPVLNPTETVAGQPDDHRCVAGLRDGHRSAGAVEGLEHLAHHDAVVVRLKRGDLRQANLVSDLAGNGGRLAQVVSDPVEFAQVEQD